MPSLQGHPWASNCVLMGGILECSLGKGCGRESLASFLSEPWPCLSSFLFLFCVGGSDIHSTKIWGIRISFIYRETSVDSSLICPEEAGHAISTCVLSVLGAGVVRSKDISMCCDNRHTPLLLVPPMSSLAESKELQACPSKN